MGALMAVLSEMMPRFLHTRMWWLLADMRTRSTKEIADALIYAYASSSSLELWWVLMSAPVWILCLFLAYHSLEFYVQLRVRHLGARVDRACADAIVFERGSKGEV